MWRSFALIFVFSIEKEKTEVLFLRSVARNPLDFILTGCSSHEYQGPNLVVSVWIKIHCNRHNGEWN